MEKVNCCLIVPLANSRARVAQWVKEHDACCETLIILSIVIINAIVTIWRARHEPSTVAFVVFCYAVILFLHWCLGQFEGASAKKKRVLKASSWILITLLMLALCQRAAGIMPPVIAIIIWVICALFISGTFYCLIVFDDAGPKVEGKSGDKQPC